MPDKSMISRVIDWLSVGYPKDVPVQDRAAVMAILKMRLTDEQLQEVVRQLMQSSCCSWRGVRERPAH